MGVEDLWHREPGHQQLYNWLVSPRKFYLVWAVEVLIFFQFLTLFSENVFTSAFGDTGGYTNENDIHEYIYIYKNPALFQGPISLLGFRKQFVEEEIYVATRLHSFAHTRDLIW